MNNQIDLIDNLNNLNLFDELPQNNQYNIHEYLNIFGENGNQINITTYFINNEPYFKGKDMLIHLGYPKNKETITKIFKEIKDVDDEFCIKLEKILKNINIPLQPLSQNIQKNIKEYFLNHDGLIYLKKITESK